MEQVRVDIETDVETDVQVDVEVAVIGGGAAGLSGALTMGRMRRSVLVIDDGHPRNAPAEEVHGYLSRDGVPPAELLAAGRAELEAYGVRFASGRVREAAPGPDGFVLTLTDGTRVRAGRLLLASGLTDHLPELPGLRERWGRDVLHCPFCHGWEVRDQAVGVLATHPMAAHQVQLLRLLTDDLTVFVQPGVVFGEVEVEQLAARGIAVVDGAVAELVVQDDRLIGVRLADGRRLAVDALAVGPAFSANTDGLDGLGLRTVEHPSGLGVVVEADANGATSVPGVWAAGNVTNPAAQVSTSVAAGAWAGAMITASLAQVEVAAAVAARRDRLVA